MVDICTLDFMILPKMLRAFSHARDETEFHWELNCFLRRDVVRAGGH
jgi:hypothetical protein